MTRQFCSGVDPPTKDLIVIGGGEVVSDPSVGCLSLFGSRPFLSRCMVFRFSLLEVLCKVPFVVPLPL